MLFEDLPLGELDDDRTAILEPSDLARGLRLPRRVVLSFFFDVLERRGSDPESGFDRLHTHHMENGPRTIWQIGEGDDAVAVLNPGTGGPTSVTMLELCLAAGAEVVVAVGGAGALVDDLAMGNVVVPTRALRDEGTSFHYLPPSRWQELDTDVASQLGDFLDERGVPHVLAPVWTTDALFRETPDKVARRRDEGCVLVDMECASLAAVCAFRDVPFGQLLYAGDSLSAEEWDERDWKQAVDTRESLLDLAIDAVRTLE